MAKKSKSDPTPESSEIDPETVAQDAVEDAVVIEETLPEDSEKSAPSDSDAVADETDAVSLTEPETDEPLDPKLEEDAADETAQVDEPSDAVAREEAAEPPVAASPRKSGAGAFLGFVIGGVIAAAIGFGAARYVVPEGWPFPGTQPDGDPIAEALDMQAAQLEDLAAKVATTGERLDALPDDGGAEALVGQVQADLVAAQSQVNEGIASLETRLDDLAARLDSLEKMPGGESAAAAALAADAYRRDLEQMRAEFEAELEKIASAKESAQQLEVDAAAAANAAAARAALSRIMAALETGQPFDQAVFDYETATQSDAPPALKSLSETGVPTLAHLQEGFPPMARAALDAAIRDAVAEGTEGRVSGFLRTQLGMRSLEPQEGDDPDAILSRAEFALKNARLSEALEELAAMPEVSHPIMTDWIKQTQTRLDAIEAGQALAAENK